MNKRQLASECTKRKLLEAATDLIGKNGYDAVAVEDNITAAGVAKGSFYSYFKRKEDIVSE